MYKLLALGLVLLSFTGCISTQEKPKFNPIDAREAVDFKPMAIVRLYYKGSFVCSGVAISYKMVLTAAHCLVGDLQVVSDDKTVKADSKVLGKNNRVDLAILTGDFKQFNAMPVAYKGSTVLDIVYNDTLVSCGFPMGGDLICVAVGRSTKYDFGIASNAFLYPGMSGGPVFGLQSGYIVGVNQAVAEHLSIYGITMELFETLDLEVEK